MPYDYSCLFAETQICGVVSSSGSFATLHRGEAEPLITPVWVDNEAGRY